ncbi:MAG: hypothetical protein ACRD2U_16155 [Terriglobales bacterium]
MTRTPWLLILCFLLFLCLAANVMAQPTDFVPAGTLLHCTLDEPNFSSKTVAVGDPTICYLSSVTSFGHSVFPRGAYLTGRLQEAKNPGHFVGKGWLEIDFDRVIIPGPLALPLSAKIIAAPHYKVDKAGKIHGKGHPVRDAVEWSLPPLWPEKILTLPRRGPYPTLKGEYRMTLRLMEDIEVPAPVRAAIPMPRWATPSGYFPAPQDPRSHGTTMLPASAGTPSAPLVRQATYTMQTAVVSKRPLTAEPTLLALKDGSAILADQYWIEANQVHCFSENVGERLIPLEALDLSKTVRLNQERHVNFVLKSKSRDVVTQQ